MKRVLLFLWIFILFWINSSFWYEYLEEVWWYKWKVFKIEKDDSYKVVVRVSEKWESLESLVKKTWWVAWINWAFFCPKDYSRCGGKNYSEFDRISNWNIYSKWKNTWVRYIFGFDKNNKPLIYKTPNDQRDTFEWIYHWLSNFPLILKEWKSFLSTYENLIDAKMRLKWPKNFICSTKTETIYMWHLSNMTIYDMVGALQNIGCYNALNLDSWWSLSLYNNGWYKTWPWRDIMDAFVIVKDETKVKNKLKEKFTFENKANIEKLNKKADLFSDKLIKLINKKSNSSKVKILIIKKLNNILSRKLSLNNKYLVERIIENLRKG